MMLLIVEYIPHIAFAGAAALVGWVAFDVLRSRKRTKAVVETTQDSGRGLAGPAGPLVALAVDEDSDVEADDQAAEVVSEVVEPETYEEAAELAPPEELELPVSQARELAPEPDEAEEIEPEADTPVVAANVIPVRRDPSVRVFDTAVAPSERKVLSAED